jgi:zinc finger protein
MTFPGNCPNCNVPGETRMVAVGNLSLVSFNVSDIPFFKEVIIMATNCDTCGYRSNEVKGLFGYCNINIK